MTTTVSAPPEPMTPPVGSPDTALRARVLASYALAGVGMLSTHGLPAQLVTSSGLYLPRERVVDALVQLHMYLGRALGKHLNHHLVRLGIDTLLENPQLGQIVIAWDSDFRILGQLEIKKLFEVWYNASYWYLDNFAVFPQFQHQGVATALLDFVKRWSEANAVSPVRLYVADHNTAAKTFYEHRNFESKGYLMECPVPSTISVPSDNDDWPDVA